MLLARAGIASRREAERLIAAGEVQVNGRVVDEPGARAVEGRDHVKVSGRLIQGGAPLRYFAYHKPVGCVSTMSDPEGRFCVGDVVEATRLKGLYPVGRLDYHSAGLLLLTNDGVLAQRLSHPRSHLEKRYVVKVNPRPSREAIEILRAGVKLRDGRTAPAYVRELTQADGKAWIDVRITEGRNQQVRRMFEAIGSRVEKLRREAIGPLELGDLQGGDLRRLTPTEVLGLQEAVGLVEITVVPAPRPRRSPRVVSTPRRSRRIDD